MSWGLVARKELLDHLRDRRSVLSAGAMALVGPGVVLIVSLLLGRTAGPAGEAVMIGMLSVFALVSSFAGATDIAMDSTAGERERRSTPAAAAHPGSAAGHHHRQVAGRDRVRAGRGRPQHHRPDVGARIRRAKRARSSCAPARAVDRAWRGRWRCSVRPCEPAGCGPCRSTKEAHTALRFLVFVPMLVGMFLVFFPRGVGRAWFLLPVVGQQALIGFREVSVPLPQTFHARGRHVGGGGPCPRLRHPGADPG